MSMQRRPHQQSNRMRGNVRLIFLAAGLALVILLILLLFLQSNSTSGTSQSPDPEVAPTVQAPVVLPGRIDRDVPIPNQGLIRIVDELTGENLVIPIQLAVDSASSLTLSAGETASIPPLGPESTLSYGLLDGAKFAVPADGRIAFSSDTWKIHIPYVCRVVVTIPPDLLSYIDRKSEIGVLQPPEIDKSSAPVDHSSLAVLFQQQLSDTTFHGAMNRLARKKSSSLMKASCDEQSIPPLLVPARGIYVIGLLLEDGTAAFSPVELTPGTEAEVFVDLKLRPLLTGILLDWIGEPVANEEVIFSTSLDLLDYDLSPRDSAGLVAIRVNGTIYQTTKYRVRTDADGRFAVRVPRGRDHCIESNARGSRAFWNTRDSGIVLDDSAEVELRLEDPNSDSVVHIKILRANGIPFSGSEVQIGVGDDIPFIRQWALKPLDENGQVDYCGLKSGDVFSVSLYHSNLQGGMFTPVKMVVPTDHLVTVVIPDSAFIP